MPEPHPHERPDEDGTVSPRRLGGGRFEVLHKLGEGGLGVVYAAMDHERAQPVALKTLPDISPQAIGRFKHEFRALADVAHPNLVRLHELFADGADWFFTMEWVRGVSLIDYLRGPSSRPPLAPGAGQSTLLQQLPTVDIGLPHAHTERQPAASTLRSSPAPPPPSVPRRVPTTSGVAPRTNTDASTDANTGANTDANTPAEFAAVRRSLAQVVLAVDAIHAAGKLHCDLKPTNVVVEADTGRVVVLDFGLVTELARTGLSPDATGQDTVCGTPSYMSPEQAAGHSLTEASDWYAVGVMLHEALTGRAPFEGTAVDVMRAKVSGEAPALDSATTGLPQDLVDLCHDLLRRAAWERPDSSEVLARLAAAPDPQSAAQGGSDIPRSQPPASLLPRAMPPVSLVGRQQELARLLAAADASRAQGPCLRYLEGPSGVGKSTLVNAFVRRLRQDDDAVVLHGRCREREQVPFKAFDGAMDALAAHLETLTDTAVAGVLPRDVHSLARIFPVLTQVRAVAQAPTPNYEVADPHQLRKRAFAAVKELLARLADRGPLVLCLDDVQWGDADSAALLLELLSPPDPPAMLVVASYRGDAAAGSPLLRALRERHPSPATDSPVAGAAAPVQQLVLGPLAEADALELARNLEAQHGVEESRATEVVREAAGNPFFVGQLVHYLATQAATPAELGTLSLEHVTLARRAALPDAAQRLLEVLAVAAHPMSPGGAAAAARVGDAEAALAMLRSQAWTHARGPRGDSAIECFHDRIREIVAGALGDDGRQRYHLDIARTLRARGEGSPVQLAQHFLAGGARTDAAHHAVLAADHAAHALAFDDAAQLYEMALEAGQHDADGRRTLLERRADALAHAGRAHTAGETYLAAAEGLPADRALGLRRRAAEQLLASGHLDEGTAALDSVLSAVDMRLAPTPRRALASLVGNRVRVRLRGLNFTRREEADVDPALLMRIDTCWAVASGLALVDTVRANDFQARHLLLALQAGEPSRLVRALSFESGFVATAGSQARARATALSETAQALAESLQEPYGHAVVAMTSGMIAYLSGDWPAALRQSEAAEKLLSERCTGVLWELSAARRFLLSSLAFMGRLRSLGQRAPALLRDARQRSNLYAETDLHTRLLTPALLAAGDPDRAIADSESALRRWSHQGFHLQHYNHLMTATQCDMYRGQPRAALARMQATWPALSRSMLLRIQSLRVELLHLRGRLSLQCMGAGGPERGPLREVRGWVKQLRTERVDWADGCAASLEAGLAGLHGDHRAAEAALRQAISTFDGCQMALHAAAARARLADRLGGQEGNALRGQSDAYFAAEGVVAPDRMTRLMNPI